MHLSSFSYIILWKIFDNEYFSPYGLFSNRILWIGTKILFNLENLGYTSVHLVDILPFPFDKFLTQPSLPFTEKNDLNNGSSVVIKCVVQIITTQNQLDFFICLCVYLNVCYPNSDSSLISLDSFT